MTMKNRMNDSVRECEMCSRIFRIWSICPSFISATFSAYFPAFVADSTEVWMQLYPAISKSFCSLCQDQSVRLAVQLNASIQLIHISELNILCSIKH